MVMTDDTTDLDAATENPDEVEGAEDEGRRWWPFVVAALVVLIGVSLVIPAARHQWALSLVRQPDHYTALSFQHAGDLPHTVVAGGAVHVAFTVSNHEGRRMDYAYRLTIAQSSAKQGVVFHRATVSVPNGGARIESITVRPFCGSTSCRLQVSLPGQSEAIAVLLDVRHHAG
jgi:hypothetical protein